MPFKSEAQRRKFYSLMEQGKISKEVVDRWEAETPKGPLPERVSPKKAQKKSVPAMRKKAAGPRRKHRDLNGPISW